MRRTVRDPVRGVCVMKFDGVRRFLLLMSFLFLFAIVGCDDNGSDVDGILAIIYAVGDLVIGIIRTAT